MTDPDPTLPPLADGATHVPLPDGRLLEVLEAGDPGGFPLLFHGGQPSAVAPFPHLDRAARATGLRVVWASRPGYGASTPRPLPAAGPRVVDDVADAEALLDHLGLDEVVTLGWSGGGPRALACAALLPGRCRAAASLAGAAPYDAAGLDWSAGMAADNVAEYAAAARGAEAYEELLERFFGDVGSLTADDVVGAFGDLLTPVDVAALAVGPDGGPDPQPAEWLAAQMRRAGAQGVRGVRDDGLAVVAPWGVDLATVTVPVAVWQGRQDAMVPFAHGVWLAEHVPGARAHLEDDEGHVSLVLRLPEVLAGLRDLAGLPPHG